MPTNLAPSCTYYHLFGCRFKSIRFLPVNAGGRLKCSRMISICARSKQRITLALTACHSYRRPFSDTNFPMLLVKDTVYVEPLRMDYISSYSLGRSVEGHALALAQGRVRLLWSADVRDQVEGGQYIGFLSFHGQCSVLGEKGGGVGISRGSDIGTGTGNGFGHRILCFNQADGDSKSEEQKDSKIHEWNGGGKTTRRVYIYLLL